MRMVDPDEPLRSVDVGQSLDPPFHPGAAVE
jgi:hypothetical protein